MVLKNIQHNPPFRHCLILIFLASLCVTISLNFKLKNLINWITLANEKSIILVVA